MFFNKDKFQELAPSHVSRKVPAKDLQAMHGMPVRDIRSLLIVEYVVDGNQKEFFGLSPQWCDENKQAELF